MSFCRSALPSRSASNWTRFSQETSTSAEDSVSSPSAAPRRAPRPAVMVGLDAAVRAHRFGASGRLTHSHSESSFYGSNYYAALPGPGRYETNASTLDALKPLSKTRVSDWPRRYRNCRPLQGSQATASMSGVDSLLEVPSPAPGSYREPDSTFGPAVARRNYWNANFASKTARFPPTRRADDTITRHLGEREHRGFHRSPPPRHESATFPTSKAPISAVAAAAAPAPEPRPAARGPPVNVYALEGDPAELPLEQPSYLTGDGGVSFEEGGQYYARDDDGDPGPPRMTWVTPRRAPPPRSRRGEPREAAAVLLKHKGSAPSSRTTSARCGASRRSSCPAASSASRT
ncbi:hypothetical protein JL721_11138 [Aureococcus anophagefferens]|nr:hypothetical protein JL721_11138 [Aureococcus anophagefferens]